jgi:hypothetical protein
MVTYRLSGDILDKPRAGENLSIASGDQNNKGCPLDRLVARLVVLDKSYPLPAQNS